MSKKGPEYIESGTRRLVNNAVASAMLAGLIIPSTVTAGATILEHRTLNPFYVQERLGKDLKPVNFVKFQTLPDIQSTTTVEGGYAHPDASMLARIYRRLNVDEVPQLPGAVFGDLSLFGIRLVTREHFDYYCSIAPVGLGSEWIECYKLNPGLFNEGSLYTKSSPTHTEEDIIKRLVLDVIGTENASFRNDMRTLRRLPAGMLGRELAFPEFETDQAQAFLKEYDATLGDPNLQQAIDFQALFEGDS